MTTAVSDVSGENTNGKSWMLFSDGSSLFFTTAVAH